MLLTEQYLSISRLGTTVYVLIIFLLQNFITCLYTIYSLNVHFLIKDVKMELSYQ